MFEMYRSTFKLPSNRVRDVRIEYSMATETITPSAGLVYRYRIKVVDTWIFAGSRYVYCHQNTPRRTGSRLKRRHCVIHVLSIVVRRTRAAVSFYVVLSSEGEVMVAEHIEHAAANVDEPNEHRRDCCKHARFLTKGP